MIKTLITIILLIPSIVSAQVLSPNRGGTGTSTIPTYGKVLVGNALGTYSVVATSSLGIVGSAGSSASSTLYIDNNIFTGRDTFAYASTTLLTLLGGLYDGSNSLGTAGFLLMSTGAGTKWVASTTFGTGLTYSGGAVTVNTSQNITTLSNLTTAGTVNTTASGVLYSTGTSSPTATAPITYSGTFGSFIGGVGGAFDCTTANATTKGCISASDFGKATSATTTFGTGLTYTLATNAVTLTTPVTIALGGTNSTSISSRNLVWFDGTSITATGTVLTVGSLIGTTTATSTFLGGLDTTKVKTSATSSLAGLFLHTGGLTLGTANCSGLTNSGKLTTDASGNVFCSNDISGGGVNTGAYGQIGWYASDGTTVSATGTQLTVGNLLATSTTATSTINGNFAIGSSTAPQISFNPNGATQYSLGSSTPMSGPLLIVGTSTNATATTTIFLDSNASKGTCLVMKDSDGTGYTYISANNGVLSASLVSCL